MDTTTKPKNNFDDRLEAIEPAVLRDLLDRQEVVLVDVREPGEHKQEKIPGSVRVSLSQFDPKQIPDTAGKLLVLHCRTNNRSTQAAQKLLTAGYPKVTYLDGGLNAWKAAGYVTKIDHNAPISLMRQVKIVAGSLVLTGVLLGTLIAPGWYILSGFVGAGLMFAGITNTCALGMLLAKLPYNQKI